MERMIFSHCDAPNIYNFLLETGTSGMLFTYKTNCIVWSLHQPPINVAASGLLKVLLPLTASTLFEKRGWNIKKKYTAAICFLARLPHKWQSHFIFIYVHWQQIHITTTKKNSIKWCHKKFMSDTSEIDGGKFIYCGDCWCDVRLAISKRKPVASIEIH